MMDADEKNPVVPEIFHNPNDGRAYQKTFFLRKGTFSKHYEIKDVLDGNAYVSKIFSRKLLTTNLTKYEKILQDCTIHRQLFHKNILRLFDYFEDTQNMYFIMDLCKIRMLEVIIHRRRITYYECRFFIHQILEGVKYLHDNQIIHRDLKLENLFLNEDLNVRIGGFGLATKIEFEGERKTTLCSLRCNRNNIIAPEMLWSPPNGHSYEVDIWSIGYIMFTLLVGQPPVFSTFNLGSNVNSCPHHLTQYDHMRRIPAELIWKSARKMIYEMLNFEPKKRPNINELFEFEFISDVYKPMPQRLPFTCISMVPRTDRNKCCFSVGQIIPPLRPPSPPPPLLNSGQSTPMVINNNPKIVIDAITISPASTPKINLKYVDNIEQLNVYLIMLLESVPINDTNNYDIELTKPNKCATFWITKWCDCSEKYGFGYRLCDNSIGFMFNDTSKLMILANGINIHYIHTDDSERYITDKVYPAELKPKMKILIKFYNHCKNSQPHQQPINNYYLKTHPFEGDYQFARVPRLHTWFRTHIAIVMHLTNGSVQMNFFKFGKGNFILCPQMRSVTCFESTEQLLPTPSVLMYAYQFSTLGKIGIHQDFHTKLVYAQLKINQLIKMLLLGH